MEANSLAPKLRFKDEDGNNYPDWEENKLGDIATFYNSKRVALTASDREKGRYPYYGASGIIDYVKDFIFEGEYILLGEDGANIVMRNSRLVFLAKGKFWLNNHAHIFQSKDSNAFLCEALERINYTKYNTGTAQPKLNSDVVKKIKLKLPSLPEQNKIASFLTSVDNKINLITKKKALLETYKKGVMQKIFSQEIRFKDEDGNDFPDWEENKLGEYCSFTQGIQIPQSKQEKYHKEGYVRYLYIRDFFSTSFKCYVKDEHPNKIIEEHQIMMVNTGNTSGSAYRGQRGVLSNNCFRISWDEKLFDADYMFLYLTSNFIQKKIKQFFNSGGQPHLGHKNAAILPLNYPCFNEQYKIASFINSLDKKIEQVDFQLQRNKEFKKGLLQQMFV